GAGPASVPRRRRFVVRAGLVAMPCLWLLGPLGALGGLIAVAAVMGFFLLAALPISIAMVGEDRTLGPQVGSTAVGVILLSGNLGGAAIVGLMGLLKTAQGDFAGAIILELALALGAVALALPLPETGAAAHASEAGPPAVAKS